MLGKQSGFQDSWLSDLAKEPPLSPAEEKRLSRAFRKGDMEARDRLVRANLRFVIRTAKAYRNQGLPFEDLVQEGCLGLIKGIDRFDPEKGFRLMSYAGWWINLYMQRALEQKSRPVRIPGNQLTMLRKVNSFREEYQARHGKRPSIGEIAKALETTPTRIESVLCLGMNYVSISESREEEDVSLEYHLGNLNPRRPDRGIYIEQLRTSLRKIMSILSPRERTVLEERFGLGDEEEEEASLRKVAGRMGVTAEGVRNMEQRAFAKMRRFPVLALLRKFLSLILLFWAAGI